MGSTYDRYFQQDLSELTAYIKTVDIEKQEDKEEITDEFHKIIVEAIKNIPGYEMLSVEDKKNYIYRLFGLVRAKDVLNLRDIREGTVERVQIRPSEAVNDEVSRNQEVSRKLSNMRSGRVKRQSRQYKRGIINLRGVEIDSPDENEDDFFFI